MSYKILTKNGIDNTNIDGARGEHFNAGMRSGIVKGALNEGNFNTNASNSLFLDSCELRICGHRIVINDAVYKTFSNAPASATRYSYIAQIIVDDNSNVDFSLLVQPSTTKLIQDNLYKTTNGAGTYQLEIGRFTLQTDGTITDIVKTADIITGGSTGSNIQSGNVTIEKTVLDSPAEGDIDVRYEEDEGITYIDLELRLPIDLTEVEEKTNQALTNSQTAVDTSNQANLKSEDAKTKSTNAENMANQANTKSEDAVSTAEVAKGKADSAITTASDAKTIAEGAETTANGIDAKATEALSNSETAMKTAQKAMDSVTEGLGTKVYKTDETNILPSLNIDDYLNRSGGTMTGDLTVGSSSIGTNGYIKGVWLQTTANTNSKTKQDKIAVIDSKGWIYSRTPEQIRDDIGAISTAITKTDFATLGEAWEFLNTNYSKIAYVTFDAVTMSSSYDFKLNIAANKTLTTSTSGVTMTFDGSVLFYPSTTVFNGQSAVSFVATARNGYNYQITLYQGDEDTIPEYGVFANFYRNRVDNFSTTMTIEAAYHTNVYFNNQITIYTYNF